MSEASLGQRSLRRRAVVNGPRSGVKEYANWCHVSHEKVTGGKASASGKVAACSRQRGQTGSKQTTDLEKVKWRVEFSGGRLGLSASRSGGHRGQRD